MLRSRISDYIEPAPAEQALRPRPVPPPLYLLGALAGMALLERFVPGPKVVPSALQRLGVVGILGGIALSVWGATLFRRTGTTLDPAGEPKALVTEGPFRFTRNPMYLAMTIILGGVAVLLGRLLPLLAIPAFVGLLTARVIRGEEQTLEQTFGEDYRRYRAGVPRWL